MMKQQHGPQYDHTSRRARPTHFILPVGTPSSRTPRCATRTVALERADVPVT